MVIVPFPVQSRVDYGRQTNDYKIQPPQIKRLPAMPQLVPQRLSGKIFRQDYHVSERYAPAHPVRGHHRHAVIFPRTAKGRAPPVTEREDFAQQVLRHLPQPQQ